MFAISTVCCIGKTILKMMTTVSENSLESVSIFSAVAYFVASERASLAMNLILTKLRNERKQISLFYLYE